MAIYVNKHILRLQVPVHDILGVYFLKSNDDFSHVELDNVVIYASFGSVSHEVEKSSSNTRLHCKIQLILCLKRIVQVYNEGERVELLHNVGFVQIDVLIGF